MEEREALKRQIELLQNLIDKHKSVHGDAPFSGGDRRHPEVSGAAQATGLSSSVPHSSGRRTYQPLGHRTWRRMYSLQNKSLVTSSSSHQSTSDSAAIPNPSREHETRVSTGARTTFQKKETSTSGFKREEKKKHTVDVGACSDRTPQFQQRPDSRKALKASEKGRSSSEVPPLAEAKPLYTAQRSTVLQKQSFRFTKTNNTTSVQSIRTPTPPTATPTMPSVSDPAVSTKRSVPHTPPRSTTGQINEPFTKRSKFTWIKSQCNTQEESRLARHPSQTGKAVDKKASVSKTAVSTASSSAVALSKKTPPKRLPKKLSPSTTFNKTSKYRWVSSAGSQVRTPRKSLSPKSLTPTSRSLEKIDSSRKIKVAASPSIKLKKGPSRSSPSHCSRYRWKTAEIGGTQGTLRKSAFHWTADRSSRAVKGGFGASPVSINPQRTQLPSSSPGAFKLRSRMKIIRRLPNSGGASAKEGAQAAGKLTTRSRSPSLYKSPTGARRTPSRELVAFGRHKLRRLSPTLTRANPASSAHRSPASQRVFRTRYKMVTRPNSSATHTFHYNPALSWRARRIQCARSFLQNRLRSPSDRHLTPSQRWAESGMCWIRGSLYRVSANKLSRTANMSINRTGKPSGSPLTRASGTRHLANRAVQRSIAIIRHARQKKQQKQYCMFYNRFGKCNRGTSCPFIHDPDKVAVCTRFLRGTCKQADGACPFSHKVSKEKMPVCSYFLKGICNNSDCPYSHVYVSRKAEVCQDFVKGYCPAGEKCKKKHTLLCPDFSRTGCCPRGSRCKLQHRQRPKRSLSSSSPAPPRKARPAEPQRRPSLSVVISKDPRAAAGTPPAGPLALPSFISLSSSPEEGDAPDTLPADTAHVKGRGLQIKPRLRPDTS